ncbi:DoxX family protein [Deinococcus cellulosilyticus]|nr:hypothetical protein [Deinococcus cellulosilyticus]
MPSVVEEVLNSPAWRRRARKGLGAFFIFTGITHFWVPKMFMSIMPKWVPYPEAAVFLSGAGELAGGLGLFSQKTRKLSAMELILLLVLVFPANIQMLLWAKKFPVPVWVLWARLPFQPLLIWLLWWSSVESEQK